MSVIFSIIGIHSGVVGFVTGVIWGAIMSAKHDREVND